MLVANPSEHMAESSRLHWIKKIPQTGDFLFLLTIDQMCVFLLSFHIWDGFFHFYLQY